MKECSKSIARRLSDPNFSNRYFVGQGLDIGGKPDPLALYVELFSKIERVRTWDREDGDAQFLQGVEDGRYDFVHSSHCLEHLDDPRQGLENWFRVLKPGGHLVLLIPDEDLYEQGAFPSTHNRDHKWTFTLHKLKSWSDKSVNLLPLLIGLGGQSEVVKVELLTSTYRFNLPRYDQTRSPVGECGIEAVVRKRLKMEVERGGRVPSRSVPLDREMRIHLNQYADDAETLRQANADFPPFRNDKELS
jgi:SAM-dependent methyltransferase